MQISQNIPSIQSHGALPFSNRAGKNNYTVSGLKSTDTVTFRLINSKEPASRNKFQLNYAIDGLGKVEKAMEEIVPLLQKQRELAIMSSKWFISDTERQYMQIDLDEINEEIGKIMEVLSDELDVGIFIMPAIKDGMTGREIKDDLFTDFLALNRALSVIYLDLSNGESFDENENNAALLKTVMDIFNSTPVFNLDILEELNEAFSALAEQINNSDMSTISYIAERLKLIEDKIAFGLEAEWEEFAITSISEKYKDAADAFFELSALVNNGLGLEIDLTENIEDAILKIDETIELMKELGKNIVNDIFTLERLLEKFSADVSKKGIEITRGLIIRNAGNAVLSNNNISKDMILSLVR